MQGDADQQNASSQPANDVGPNGSETQPNAVTSGMTASQATDYYNKTQGLARDRQQFEADKLKFEQERQGFFNQYQNQNQFQQQYPGYQYPSQFHQGPNQFQSSHQMGMQNPNDPATYGALVKELGADAAQAILHTFNQYAQPFQQALATAQQELQKTQAVTLMGEIKARGKEAYGSEWAKHESKVMDNIMRYGVPLEASWAMATAANAKQDGINQAYQTQQVKEQSNVARPGPAPTQATPSVKSFDDAFNAAYSQHTS